MPEKLSLIIYHDIAAPPFDNRFHYRSVVRKSNLLETITRRDTSYKAHQVARFYKDSHHMHGCAVDHLVSYLHGTRDGGLILDLKSEESFEVYTDADFSGN